MSETDLTKRILKWLRGNGFWAVKRHAGKFATRVGLPDIDALKDGQSFDFEVKVPGNKPTKIQQHEIFKLRKFGSIAGVVWSVDDVAAVSESFEVGGFKSASWKLSEGDRKW